MLDSDGAWLEMLLVYPSPLFNNLELLFNKNRLKNDKIIKNHHCNEKNLKQYLHLKDGKYF
jgi:hypothetical protein